MHDFGQSLFEWSSIRNVVGHEEPPMPEIARFLIPEFVPTDTIGSNIYDLLRILGHAYNRRRMVHKRIHD